MRVLHVVTNLELAGAQLSVASICRGLRSAGLDVHLAYSSRGGRTAGSDRPLVEMLRGAGVPLHDLPALRRGVALGPDLRALADLTALVRRLAPAIVHTHMSKAGVLGRLAAAFARAPRRVHSVRGWSFYAAPRLLAPLAVAAERIAARGSTMFAVSRSVIADGVARGIGSADAYHLVHSGVDLARFAAVDRDRARAALGIPAGMRVVGAVMAFTRAKAPVELVRVAARVLAARPDVMFVIAGYGPLEPAIRDEIARHGIAARVRLVGLREDVEQLYGALDVLLVTSHWEGLPRVTIEALCAGVPVVTTDVGGCTEVVRHGETGVVTRAGDLAALTAGVLRVLDDAQMPHRVRAAAAGLAPYHLSHVIAQHLALYRALAR